MDASDENSAAQDAARDRPRALIHKKILAAAEESPTASMAAVADEVSGASVDLVDRVLAEYGDPATDSAPAEDEAESESASAAASSPPDESTGTGEPQEPVPTTGDDGPGDQSVATSDSGQVRADGATEGASLDDATTGTGTGPGPETADEPTTESPGADSEAAERSPTAFDERQLSVLRVVHERPDATQGEIAEELDVSRGTVSRRLGKVDGFEWADREAFVRRLFGDGTGSDEQGASDQRPGEQPVDATDGPDGTAAPETEAENGGSGESTDSAAESGEYTETGSDPRDVDGSLVTAVTDLSGVVESLASDVDRLEDRLDDAEAVESDDEPPADADDETVANGEPADAAVLDDPELAHKVVHACVDADYVSEDEELRVLRAILGGSDTPS